MHQSRFGYSKYHAFGNVYLVADAATSLPDFSMSLVSDLCDPHYGLGSDGLLVGPLETGNADFGLCIYNPDGSQAEMSGNGVRIFARYLYDQFYVQADTPFSVGIQDRIVHAEVSAGASVRLNLGQPQFSKGGDLTNKPVEEELRLASEEVIRFYRASMGNPHCVILRDQTSENEAQLLGPEIECHPAFPERTNVQFAQIIDANTVKVFIWERGAGYTQSSGSSASAVAAVLHGLGLAASPLSVIMPGGALSVTIDTNGDVVIEGPVTPICRGTWSPELRRTCKSSEPEPAASETVPSKSSIDEIRARFDKDVDRFSQEGRGQESTMDASVVLDLVAQIAVNARPNAEHVLDIGCGAGNYCLRLLQQLPALSCTLVDLSSNMLSRANARISEVAPGRITTKQGDIRDLSLPDDSYDIVTAGAVLHHLRNEFEWHGVFRKILRSLRPGGIFLISDLVSHDDEDVDAVMQLRYAEYLRELRDAEYQKHVFQYIEYEDSPRSTSFQLDLLTKTGFTNVEVIHKNACFAALCGRKSASGHTPLDQQGGT